MKVLVQRCDKASVKVDNKIVGSVDKGMMILVGFTQTDTSENIDYMVDKVINLRIFDDEEGIMNTFNYTLEYVERSYKLKKNAIPEEYCMLCMPACIKQILSFTYLIVGYYWKHRHYGKTAFHQLLLDDMKRYAFHSKSIDYIALQYSNPIAGGAYLAYYHIVRVLKNMKRDFVNLHF